MFFAYVLGDAFFQLFETSWLRRPFREEDATHVLEGIAAGTADDDVFAIVFPFENRTGTDAKLPPNFSGN
jgi:hypothetical protein